MISKKNLIINTTDICLVKSSYFMHKKERMDIQAETKVIAS